MNLNYNPWKIKFSSSSSSGWCSALLWFRPEVTARLTEPYILRIYFIFIVIWNVPSSAHVSTEDFPLFLCFVYWCIIKTDLIWFNKTHLSLTGRFKFQGRISPCRTVDTQGPEFTHSTKHCFTNCTCKLWQYTWKERRKETGFTGLFC